MLVLEGLIGLHRTVQLQLYWSGHGIGLLWYWTVRLRNRDHSVIFETASKYCIWTLLLTMMATAFLLRDSFAQSSRYNGHLS